MANIYELLQYNTREFLVILRKNNKILQSSYITVILLPHL